MTGLDEFTHQVFVSHGAPLGHAVPVAKRVRRLPVHLTTHPAAMQAVTHAAEIASDTAVSLFNEALKDSLVAAGAVGAFLEHVGPAASLPIVIVIVVIVKYSAGKIVR